MTFGEDFLVSQFDLLTTVHAAKYSAALNPRSYWSVPEMTRIIEHRDVPNSIVTLGRQHLNLQRTSH